MSKEQWTVLGLLVVLASLEVIRSNAVQNFFSGFFGQFGVGKGSSSSTTNIGTPASTATAHGTTSQSVKGMPSAGGGHPY